MREEEEEETLFDQEGLLGSGKKSSWDWDWVQRFTKTLALSLSFFALVSVHVIFIYNSIVTILIFIAITMSRGVSDVCNFTVQSSDFSETTLILEKKKRRKR